MATTQAERDQAEMLYRQQYRERVKPQLFDLMAEVTQMRSELNMPVEVRMEHYQRSGKKAPEVVVVFQFNTKEGYGRDESDTFEFGLDTGEEWEFDSLMDEVVKQRKYAAEERERLRLVAEAKSLLSDAQLKALGLRR